MKKELIRLSFGKLKKITDWQVVFELNDVVEMLMPLLADFRFGILKFKDFPKEGDRISETNYKGFLVTIRFYKWFEFRQ